MPLSDGPPLISVKLSAKGPRQRCRLGNNDVAAPIARLKIALGCPCAVTALPVGPDGGNQPLALGCAALERPFRLLVIGAMIVSCIAKS